METITFYHCNRCSRNHFFDEVLYNLHEQFMHETTREMPTAQRPPAGHILWIQNIYDQPKADENRTVTLSLVTANESGYTPLPSLTMSLRDARKFRDEYHATLGLTEAQVEAIEASSMFYENGVRYPDNLRHYQRA